MPAALIAPIVHEYVQTCITMRQRAHSYRLPHPASSTRRNFAAAIGTVHAVWRAASSCLTCPAAGPFARTPTCDI